MRLKSLDVFRGITIAGMILVNSPGNDHAYAWLEHAEWNGLTPTDLVFPFFLFIVGISLVVSLEKRLAQGATRGELVTHILKRTLILFALGLFLNGFPKYDLATIRIPGVLQRIALAYMGGALLFLFLRARHLAVVLPTLLLGYWGLMRGDMSPEGNVAARIDQFLLSGHMYRPHYDPEGFLSTFPSIATVLMGILSVCTFQKPRIFGWAAASVVAGLLWAQFFPLNKALWTSSYVLVTGGLAMALLGLCSWVVDQKKIGRPFRWLEALGLNAIAAYVGHLLFLKIQNRIPLGDSKNVRFWISDHLLGGLTPINASLVYALTYTAIWILIAWILYRKKIFIKI